MQHQADADGESLRQDNQQLRQQLATRENEIAERDNEIEGLRGFVEFLAGAIQHDGNARQTHVMYGVVLDHEVHTRQGSEHSRVLVRDTNGHLWQTLRVLAGPPGPGQRFIVVTTPEEP